MTGTHRNISLKGKTCPMTVINNFHRMKYVTSLAMSFACLDVSAENKEIVEKSKALDYIIERYE